MTARSGCRSGRSRGRHRSRVGVARSTAMVVTSHLGTRVWPSAQTWRRPRSNGVVPRMASFANPQRLAMWTSTATWEQFGHGPPPRPAGVAKCWASGVSPRHHCECWPLERWYRLLSSIALLSLRPCRGPPDRLLGVACTRVVGAVHSQRWCQGICSIAMMPMLGPSARDSGVARTWVPVAMVVVTSRPKAPSPSSSPCLGCRGLRRTPACPRRTACWLAPSHLCCCFAWPLCPRSVCARGGRGCFAAASQLPTSTRPPRWAPRRRCSGRCSGRQRRRCLRSGRMMLGLCRCRIFLMV
mmetsp:Transcript_72942/g.237109  ORF Transcript_72942/g.237109 Transcript_72942/m.237109 type:complete len:298 (+) Transcript_72942:1929-2822(+)